MGDRDKRGGRDRLEQEERRGRHWERHMWDRERGRKRQRGTRRDKRETKGETEKEGRRDRGNKEREEGDIWRDRCETEKGGGRDRGEQGEIIGRHMERQMGDRERGRKRQRGT
jgi:hypothetical protein